MSAIAFLPIEFTVPFAEVRARLCKKGFRDAATADVSKFKRWWTAAADDGIPLPPTTTDATLIEGGTFIEFETAA